MRLAEHCAKRVANSVGGLCLLVLLGPIFPVVASLVIAMDGGPAFASQNRIGRNGRMFRSRTFRITMLGAEECLVEFVRLHPEITADWQHEQQLHIDIDPRITPIGKYLVNLGAHGLPQLWNVIKGDMLLADVWQRA